MALLFCYSVSQADSELPFESELIYFSFLLISTVHKIDIQVTAEWKEGSDASMSKHNCGRRRKEGQSTIKN